MTQREIFRHSQIMDLAAETFHRGRTGHAVVDGALCSHPEFIGGHDWYGFRCWQRRPDGQYRRVQSTRAKSWSTLGWAPRATMLGAWVDRAQERSQELAAA